MLPESKTLASARSTSSQPLLGPCSSRNCRRLRGSTLIGLLNGQLEEMMIDMTFTTRRQLLARLAELARVGVVKNLDKEAVASVALRTRSKTKHSHLGDDQSTVTAASNKRLRSADSCDSFSNISADGKSGVACKDMIKRVWKKEMDRHQQLLVVILDEHEVD
jgi:hypothetical protein